MASDTQGHKRKKRQRRAAELVEEVLVVSLDTPVTDPEPGWEDEEPTGDVECLVTSLEEPVQYLSRWDDAAAFVQATSELLSVAAQRCLYALAVVGLVVMGLEDKLAGNLVVAGIVVLVLAGGGRELLRNSTTRAYLTKMLKMFEMGDSDDQS